MPLLAHATLQPDGVTLRLDQPLDLPPGKVVVTVESSPAKPGPTMAEFFEELERTRAERGLVPMTAEDEAARVAAMRAEDEEEEDRWRAIYANTTDSLDPPEGR